MYAPRREACRAETPGRRIPRVRIHLTRAMMTLAGTMQLDQSRLLDLLAQNLRRSLVVYLGPDTRLVHSSVCARICFAIASFPTPSSRLRGGTSPSCSRRRPSWRSTTPRSHNTSRSHRSTWRWRSICHGCSTCHRGHGRTDRGWRIRSTRTWRPRRFPTDWS